jgi:hypothetical protein
MQIRDIAEEEEKSSSIQNWEKYRLPIARFSNTKFSNNRYKIPTQYSEKLGKGYQKQIENGNAKITFVSKNEGFDLILENTKKYKVKHRKALLWLVVILILGWNMAILHAHEARLGIVTWHFWLFGFHWYLLLFGTFVIMIMFLIISSEPRKEENSINGSDMN